MHTYRLVHRQCACVRAYEALHKLVQGHLHVPYVPSYGQAPKELYAGTLHRAEVDPCKTGQLFLVVLDHLRRIGRVFQLAERHQPLN